MRVNLWRPEAKRRAGIVRPAVVGGVPLSRYNHSELAVRIRRKESAPAADTGVAWARAGNRKEKQLARGAVLRLLGPNVFRRLSILTFPGMDWEFEHALIALRSVASTRIVGLERDEAIYRAAIPNMPRVIENSQHAPPIRVFGAPDFATASVGTSRVHRFFRCAFEDFAAYNATAHPDTRQRFDAAWLDFNGQLSPTRLSAIESFWNGNVRSLLVVTLLNGRTSDWTTGRIKAHGGIEHLLNDALPGSSLVHAISYGDGATMIQVALARRPSAGGRQP